MFKRTCVVKYVDSFGVEHAAKVEAESLFEAAVRGLYKLDSSFWTEEDVFDLMCVTVEVHEEPTTHTVKIEKLKQWIKSQGRHPREQAKKEKLRRVFIRSESIDDRGCTPRVAKFRPAPLLGMTSMSQISYPTLRRLA
jgi:hypothetical protein